MIRLETVTKRYGSTSAVAGLSLEVEEGEVCVLLGPSGCGKTTTLRMINRLIEPTSGRIFVGDRDTADLEAVELRRSMGYAIQSVGLFPHMTVARNIGVVPRLLGWDEERIEARTEELLELVGLEPTEYADKHPRQLSGGEAQRVGVARALAADPPTLLMDEPFGAVDPLTRDSLQGQFQRIQRELRKTVVLVTHDLDEAVRLADRIAVMREGRLVQHATPAEILSDPADRFVRDFVGPERALKRLSRVGVKGFLREGPRVAHSASVQDALRQMGDADTTWVVDDEGRLAGWVGREALADADGVEEATVREAVEEMALPEDATLREALARMLGQGLERLPAVDADGILVGEIALGDVVRATSETE